MGLTRNEVTWVRCIFFSLLNLLASVLFCFQVQYMLIGYMWTLGWRYSTCLQSIRVNMVKNVFERPNSSFSSKKTTVHCISEKTTNRFLQTIYVFPCHIKPYSLYVLTWGPHMSSIGTSSLTPSFIFSHVCANRRHPACLQKIPLTGHELPLSQT